MARKATRGAVVAEAMRMRLKPFALAGLVTVFLAGCAGDTAVQDGVAADVLFGDRPFTGRLSYTWPRSMDQLPIGPGDEPLFPLGYGLE
jgi:hypothetical protein